MKKIFISVPMRERTEEDIDKSIKKMKNIVSLMLEDEEIEFIDNHVDVINLSIDEINQLKNESVYCLGGAIQKIAQCDLIVILDVAWRYPGCSVERDVAYKYFGREQVIELDAKYIAPDVYEKIKQEARTNELTEGYY